jgi:hypothetical protein
MAGIEYTSIDEVVNDFQLLMDDTSYDKEAQIYQLRLLALQGLRELKFDTEQEVKTIEASVRNLSTASTHLSIALPDDYVKMLRIGYKGDDGNFHPFSTNPNLSLDASVSAQVNDDSLNENNPYYHTDLGKKYGQGGGNNDLGYYRVNRSDQRINFSSNLAGKTVFMEYISDGITEVQAQDHVIRLRLNGGATSTKDGSYMNKTKLTIPHPTKANDELSFRFYSANTVFSSQPTANTQIPVVALTTLANGINGTAKQLAEAFSTLINEGHPKHRASPYTKYLKASQSGEYVTLTYSHPDFIPLIGNSSPLLESNYDGNQEGDSIPLQQPIELIQLGVAGSKPSVHKFCEEALRCYVYYKYIQRKRGIPANEKQMAKRAYYNEKRLARARMMNFSKETAMQTSRKAFKQSPKF